MENKNLVSRSILEISNGIAFKQYFIGLLISSQYIVKLEVENRITCKEK